MLSDADYVAKLEYLTDRDPLCPLLPKLRKGNSAINALYLIEAISAIPVRVNKPEKKPKADSAATALEIELRHLRQSRAELSNTFINCVTDQQRAGVSKRIIEINERCKYILQRLSTYQETKDQPELPKSDLYPIPESDLDLYKLRKKQVDYITKGMKSIKRIMEMIPGVDAAKADKLRQRIVKLEEKIRFHKIYKMYADGEINRRKVT